MLPEIKPCPFCGAEGHLSTHPVSFYQYVSCRQCEAAGPSCGGDVYPDKEERRREAIRKWNDAPRRQEGW